MKKVRKDINKIYFWVVSFYFAFLPAIGLFFLSGLLASWASTLFPEIKINSLIFNIIWLAIYAITTAITLYLAHSKVKLFKRNFLISAGILLFVYFIL